MSSTQISNTFKLNDGYLDEQFKDIALEDIKNGQEYIIDQFNEGTDEFVTISNELKKVYVDWFIEALSAKSYHNLGSKL